jgi:hypothetical protein
VRLPHEKSNTAVTFEDSRIASTPEFREEIARIADFQFQKRSQLFIRVHNETLSAAMRVCNKDRSPARINR